MGRVAGKLRGIPAGRKTVSRAHYGGKELTSYRLSKAVAQLPDNVFQPTYRKDGIVSAAAKRAVLRVLADHYPNVWPSVRTVCEETALSERTVQNVLGDLRATQFVTQLSSLKGGRSSSVQYAIDVHKILDPKPWWDNYCIDDIVFAQERTVALADIQKRIPSIPSIPRNKWKSELEKWLVEDALVRTGKPLEDWLDELVGSHHSAWEAGRMIAKKQRMNAAAEKQRREQLAELRKTMESLGQSQDIPAATAPLNPAATAP